MRQFKSARQRKAVMAKLKDTSTAQKIRDMMRNEKVKEMLRDERKKKGVEEV